MNLVKVPLGDVADLVRGITFPTSAKKRTPSKGLIPCLRTTNVQDAVEWDDLIYVPDGYARSEAQRVRVGDILVSMSNSLELVGKCALVTSVPVPATFGAFIAVVRAREGIDPEYVFHAMRSPKFKARIRSVASTTTNISNINSTKLLASTVVLAGNKTRRAIVSKLNELFSRIDEGERALERVSKLVERYRQSVLKAAVTGELTRDWREARKTAGHPVESGEALLTRILTTRREAWEQAELAKMQAKGIMPKNDMWKKRYTEPSPPEVADLPELPEGWVWASVDQLAAAEAGAITDGPFGSKLKTEHYTDRGPRVVRLQNIKDGWFANEQAYISAEHFGALERHKVNEGDLLIAALGENPPRACVVPGWLGPAIVKADCIRVRLHNSVEAACVCAFLNSPPSRSMAKTIIHGVGRPRLNLGEIKSLAVPLCSTEEQLRICDRIAADFSALERLSADMRTESVHGESLRQAILCSAFSGQLVPQDPNDEPATMLLERIASACAEASISASRRGRRKKSA